MKRYLVVFVIALCCLALAQNKANPAEKNGFTPDQIQYGPAPDIPTTWRCAGGIGR